MEVHDQSCNAENRYKLSKQIRFKPSMLQSDLYDYSDAYVFVKRTIIDPDDANYKTKQAFQNNAPCISCISNIQ